MASMQLSGSQVKRLVDEVLDIYIRKLKAQHEDRILGVKSQVQSWVDSSPQILTMESVNATLTRLVEALPPIELTIPKIDDAEKSMVLQETNTTPELANEQRLLNVETLLLRLIELHFQDDALGLQQQLGGARPLSKAIQEVIELLVARRPAGATRAGLQIGGSSMALLPPRLQTSELPQWRTEPRDTDSRVVLPYRSPTAELPYRQPGRAQGATSNQQGPADKGSAKNTGKSPASKQNQNNHRDNPSGRQRSGRGGFGRGLSPGAASRARREHPHRRRGKIRRLGGAATVARPTPVPGIGQETGHPSTQVLGIGQETVGPAPSGQEPELPPPRSPSPVIKQEDLKIEEEIKLEEAAIKREKNADEDRAWADLVWNERHIKKEVDAGPAENLYDAETDNEAPKPSSGATVLGKRTRQNGSMDPTGDVEEKPAKRVRVQSVPIED